MTVPVRTSIPVHSEIPLPEPASPSQQIPIQHAAGLQTQPEASPPKPPELKSEAIAPTEPVLPPGSLAASLPASVPDTAEPASVSAVSTLMPAASVANADRGVTPAQTELAVVVHNVVPKNSDSSLQMFFDLGSFKQEQRADGLSDKLAQAGFPASVVRKGHLPWMNSYTVLVGPYANEADEKKINGDLRSRGYKPRPFERGSRDFAFRSIVMIRNEKLPTGDFAISWESYVTDAKVKFAQGHDVVATADGKWIKKPQKYSRDEYVFGKQADGSHPLLEIHFAGLDGALVFRDFP
jgi:cell division septation protein DedD